MQRGSSTLKFSAPRSFAPSGSTKGQTSQAKGCLTPAGVNMLATRVDRLLLAVEELYEDLVAVLPDTNSEGDDVSTEEEDSDSDLDLSQPTAKPTL